MGDRSEPVGIPTVEFAVTAAASLQELMLIVKAGGIRSNTTEKVGANKDRVVGGWSRCGV